MHHSTLLAFLAVPLVALASPVIERQAANSLDAAMKAKGKKYWGTATDQNRLTTGSNSKIIAADFGQVTPENSMKWDATEGMKKLQSRKHCQKRKQKGNQIRWK